MSVCLFHPLDSCGSLPPERFTYPFCYEPHPLCQKAAKEVQRHIESKKDWEKELARGKMFGVLVVEDPDGQLGFLAAYSGAIQGRNDHPYFVPPVFDYLQPDGYFKQEEHFIENLNKQIQQLGSEEDITVLKDLIQAFEKRMETIMEHERQRLTAHKKARDERRQQGGLGEAEQQALIRESQHEKAEWRRMRDRMRQKSLMLRNELDEKEKPLIAMKEERRCRSDSLQHWLFEHFVMRNARGEERDLTAIFQSTPQQAPPAGAGECAAPKLLQYAYLHRLRPRCMAEFWWGESPKGEIRRHLHFYPACQGKCKPILHFMLQGLEVDPDPMTLTPQHQELTVLYEDEWLCAVCKPAGMPSVPGKTGGTSVFDILRTRFTDPGNPIIVHRLDMATSGVLVATKTKEAHEALQRLFLQHQVRKTYIADVEGVVTPAKGIIQLPLRADFMHRPCQCVDYEKGKKAVTEYEVTGQATDGKGHTISTLSLHPQTGRTHQLRVHCAHADGLGCPIVGDTLYGTAADRLHLHAERIVFTHPFTGKPLDISCPATFKP